MPSPPSHDLKTSVQQQFGASAENYAQASFVHRQGPDLETLVERVIDVDGLHALDVGCGAGHTAHALAPHFERVVAADLTEPMLEQTRQGADALGLENVETHRADAEALPFDDGEFDVVACRLCAHHFGAPERAVAEAWRVLRPGGRFFLIDIVAPDDHTADSFLQAFEVVRDPSHVRDHSVDQWTAMLIDAGFAPPRVDRWAMPQTFDAWTTRIGASEAATRALVEMFHAAPSEVRAVFEVEGRPVESFALENALFDTTRLD